MVRQSSSLRTYETGADMSTSYLVLLPFLPVRNGATGWFDITTSAALVLLE